MITNYTKIVGKVAPNSVPLIELNSHKKDPREA